jgi:hypothetical protein
MLSKKFNAEPTHYMYRNRNRKGLRMNAKYEYAGGNQPEKVELISHSSTQKHHNPVFIKFLTSAKSGQVLVVNIVNITLINRTHDP